MFDYSLLSFILRGERRKLILLSLDKPKIPKQIAEECKVSIHNVSKSLIELMKKGLIRCKNPKINFIDFMN
jgi:predicted transcriptional regulator